MRRSFNKMALLTSLLSLFGATNSKTLKEAPGLVGYTGTTSLSKYTENNFNQLSMKRVKGKWKVKR